MSSFNYQLVVAHSYPEYGIGKDNDLPWRLRDDLQHFKYITLSHTPTPLSTSSNSLPLNVVVMGRKTFDSLPASFKPLPDRLNLVITNNVELHQKSSLKDNLVYSSWDNLTTTLQSLDNELQSKTTNSKYIDTVFIIGGATIYQQAMDNLPIQRMHITEVYLNEKKDETKFDTFLPKYSPHNLVYPLESDNKLVLEDVSPFKCEKGIYFRYLTYSSNEYMTKHHLTPFSSPEEQYLSIMRDIMVKGVERTDRTGTGTLSVFGTQQKYDLTDTFPISTTKRIFFRAVFEELALYLTGKTDNKILQEKSIHIWDGNTSRDFLDKRGLPHYPEGDMGETYGFNFRHFGGNYQDCHTEYPLDGSNGFDQIANLLHLLKNDPTSRRMLITLWNPASTHKASLPSCLMMYQFYVNTNAKTLNCQIYLRSSDYFLANNWNTCTGALLTHMICNLEDINLTPGELTVVTGDTHIYKTHLKQVNENLDRKPHPFPKLVIKEQKKDLTEFTFDDLRLVGYRTQKNIPAPMAV